MSWLQYSLIVNSDEVDFVSDILTECSALAITLEQDAIEDFEGNIPHQRLLSDAIKVIALFDIKSDPLTIIKHLHSKLDSELTTSGQWARIEDDNWHTKWQEYIKPIKITENLWVCPSWCDIPNKHAINLLIDPELAFGTGSHPTTALCLEWLADNLPPNKAVIDYGCGSGILAIAAAKLGAAKCYAVDIDSTALDVTKSNLIKNDIDLNTVITYLPDSLPKIKADAIIANILAEPLKSLAPLFASLLESNGVIALSGILAEQLDEVKMAFNPWFCNFEQKQGGDWMLLTGQRV